MTGEHCTATLVIATDNLTCYLPAGHAGPHKCEGVGGRVFWQYDR
jgi:hypothetical protein